MKWMTAVLWVLVAVAAQAQVVALDADLEKLKAARPADPASDGPWRKQYQEAIQRHFAAEGLTKSISQAVIEHALGLAQARQGEALGTFGADLAASTKDKAARSWAVHLTLQFLEMMQESKRAIELARRSLEDPLLADSRDDLTLNLAQLLQNAGETAEALKLLRGMLLAGGKAPKIKVEIGDGLLTAGLAREALVPIEEALADAEIKAHAGRAQVVAGTAHLALARTLTGDAAAKERAAGHASLALVTAATLKDRESTEGQGFSAFVTESDAHLEEGDVAAARKDLEDLAKAYAGQREAEVAERKLKELAWIGKAAPPIAGPGLDGAPVNPETWKGKVVLLDFWATWCGPCRAELPNVVKLAAATAGKPFQIVSVSLDQEGQAASVKKFAAQNKMSWAHVYDGKGWETALAQSYDVHAIPATFLIDETGKVVATGLRGEQLAPAVNKELSRLEAKK